MRPAPEGSTHGNGPSPTPRRELEGLGQFAASMHSQDTLNGVFNGTKVQFLSATDQQVLEPLAAIEGIRLAALGDLRPHPRAVTTLDKQFSTCHSDDISDWFD